MERATGDDRSSAEGGELILETRSDESEETPVRQFYASYATPSMRKSLETGRKRKFSDESDSSAGTLDESVSSPGTSDGSGRKIPRGDEEDFKQRVYSTCKELSSDTVSEGPLSEQGSVVQEQEEVEEEQEEVEEEQEEVEEKEEQE